MKESEFQKNLKQEIKKRFPGSYVLKTDANNIQGMPDLIILYKNKWAALECKKDIRAKRQPNQEYRINELNHMSYASFICPENKEGVLNAMEYSFRNT